MRIYANVCDCVCQFVCAIQLVFVTKITRRSMALSIFTTFHDSQDAMLTENRTNSFSMCTTQNTVQILCLFYTVNPIRIIYNLNFIYNIYYAHRHYIIIYNTRISRLDKTTGQFKCYTTMMNLDGIFGRYIILNANDGPLCANINASLFRSLYEPFI